MLHIEIKNLTKSYVNRRKVSRNKDPQEKQGQDVVVLNKLNFCIEQGEMVCILGPSGCGKSTMLRIVAGFEKASSGEVLINGKKQENPCADHIFVFQHSGLLPWLTVAENVGLGLRKMNNQEEKAAIIQEHIEMVELNDFENHYPGQLSGGMQRRAELARALVVNPEILIMDEPFSGLDFLTHMKMREEIVNMHEFIAKTMLMVTHDIDDALIMGDRIVILGGKPSQILLEKKINLPHPRNFESQTELSKLRDELFLMMGVSYAV